MSIVLALTLAFAIAFVLQRGFDRNECRIVWGACLAHQLGTAGLLWLHASTGSDMSGYEVHGIEVARLLRLDFLRWLPEVVSLVLRRESALPVVDTTTGATSALCGLVFFVVGDSLPAACVVISSIVLVGQVLLYRLFRAEVSMADRPVAAISCLLVPSVTFWTSGLVKEAWSLAGLGIVAYGVRAVLVKRRVAGLAATVIGGVLVAAVKPYTLLPVVLAASAWIFSARAGGKFRPAYAFGAVVVGWVGVALVGQLFPEYGMGNITGTLAQQRYYSGQAGGGSFVGDAADEGDFDVGRGDASMLGALRFLPVALMNALFRPFLFEVRNIPQAGAALETMLIIVLLVSMLGRARPRRVVEALMKSPPLIASAVFVFSFAAAVGLATQNMGTLSRYRVPMMPFYVAVVLILRRRLATPVGAEEVTAARVMPLVLTGARARSTRTKRPPRVPPRPRTGT